MNDSELLDFVVKQLDKWIEDSEKTVEILNKNGIEILVANVAGQGQGYWNIKQLIEVNREVKSKVEG